MKARSRTTLIPEVQGDPKPLKAELRTKKSTIRTNEDFVSIEWLAQRWSCASKTARQKVQTHSLGIRPAGTWLISESKVEAYEASLFEKSRNISNAAIASDQVTARTTTINDNLKKFGVTESADLKRRLLNLSPSKSRKAG